MDVRRVDDPAAFIEAAEPLLLEDEARHSLILGLAGTLHDHPAFYPDHRLWLVEEGTEVVGAALRTPPHNLVLARPRATRAVQALANAIEDDLPGVVGALPEVEDFAKAWSTRAAVNVELHRAQGIYALRRVKQVSGVAGGMREATPEDRPLLLEWWRAFAVEALGGEEPDEKEIARNVDHKLSSSDAHIALWEDDEVVSLAGFGGATPNGNRIGPVYTPPERRGRGYASALVAELSASLLDAGKRFCFLYTDLANPTANKIYVRIGYERVCESAEIVFGKPS